MGSPSGALNRLPTGMTPLCSAPSPSSQVNSSGSGAASRTRARTCPLPLCAKSTEKVNVPPGLPNKCRVLRWLAPSKKPSGKRVSFSVLVINNRFNSGISTNSPEDNRKSPKMFASDKVRTEMSPAKMPGGNSSNTLPERLSVRSALRSRKMPGRRPRPPFNAILIARASSDFNPRNKSSGSSPTPCVPPSCARLMLVSPPAPANRSSGSEVSNGASPRLNTASAPRPRNRSAGIDASCALSTIRKSVSASSPVKTPDGKAENELLIRTSDCNRLSPSKSPARNEVRSGVGLVEAFGLNRNAVMRRRCSRVTWVQSGNSAKMSRRMTCTSVSRTAGVRWQTVVSATVA